MKSEAKKPRFSTRPDGDAFASELTIALETISADKPATRYEVVLDEAMAISVSSIVAAIDGDPCALTITVASAESQFGRISADVVSAVTYITETDRRSFEGPTVRAAAYACDLGAHLTDAIVGPACMPARSVANLLSGIRDGRIAITMFDVDRPIVARMSIAFAGVGTKIAELHSSASGLPAMTNLANAIVADAAMKLRAGRFRGVPNQETTSTPTRQNIRLCASHPIPAS